MLTALGGRIFSGRLLAAQQGTSPQFRRSYQSGKGQSEFVLRRLFVRVQSFRHLAKGSATEPSQGVENAACQTLKQDYRQME